MRIIVCNGYYPILFLNKKFSHFTIFFNETRILNDENNNKHDLLFYFYTKKNQTIFNF